ncbi:MAG: hypothetical protein AAGK22_06140 [Acidobacteriota bacterium]
MRERTGASASVLSLGPAWLLLLSLAGCSLQGPGVLRTSRMAYNEAVQESEQRELLLNLVRLRYAEAPEFLAVSSISTQMRFDAGAAVGVEASEGGPGRLTSGANVGYSESPTVTFVPRRDEAFTRQLVAPVELETLFLLTRSGWGLDRVLLLIADQMNGLSNRVTREAQGDDTTALQRFREATALLRRLEIEGLVRVEARPRRVPVSEAIASDRIGVSDHLAAAREGLRLEERVEGGVTLVDEQTHFVLRFSKATWRRDEVTRLARSLGLEPGLPSYEIDIGSTEKEAGALLLTTRSVLGVLAYLSHAVAVPDEDADRVSRTPSDETVHEILDIRVASQPVEDAFLSVPHRGRWFYIDDRDLESKRTLGLLTSLLRLSLGAGGAQNVPLLTLPVSF